MVVSSPTRPAGVLVGRDAEMAALIEGVEAARDRRPSTVLIGGDAGIGKTRLLTEFVARMDERVLWGGCLPLGERGVPYLPLIEMIRSLSDRERDSLPKALETIAPMASEPPVGKAASRAHLFQALIGFFEDLASEKPLIVIVEDLHWADRSTRDLLDFLIGLLRDQRILLVASIRTDDLPTGHPLRTQLIEWLRRPSVRRLDLEPLSTDDALRLIAPLLTGSGVTQEQTLRLVERGDGNPFLLEELAAAGPDFSGLSGPIRDDLLRRTHDLSPALIRVLRIAAVGGTAINEEVLCQVAALEADEARELLRSGVDARVLAIDSRGCRFRHALLAEALYADLLPAERREYHAAYAHALQSRTGSVSAGQLATHLAEGGRLEEALRAWVSAAQIAESQFAFYEAEQGYQSAFDSWEIIESPEVNAGITRAELLERLAEVSWLAGDPANACDVARHALDEIDPDADPVTAGLFYQRLARYVRNTEEYGESLALQRRAAELVPASRPSPERAEVLSGLALILQFENRYIEARDVAIEAIEVAVETGALDAEIRARSTLGETTCNLEDLDRGLAIIGDAVDIARQKGNAHEHARGLWNMQANRFFGGRLTDFVDNSASTIATLRITQPHWILDHMLDTADALQMLGRWEEADAVLDAARREYPTLARRVGVPELSLARRDIEEAETVVAAHAELVGFLGPDVTGRVLNLVTRAGIEMTKGNARKTIGLVRQALERYPSLEKPTYISHGIATAIRAAADLAHAARIRGDSAALEEATQIGDHLHQDMLERANLPGPSDGWKREVGCIAAQCEAELSRLHGEPDPDAWMRANLAWLGLSMPYRAAYCRFRWAEDALASGADRAEVETAVRELSDFLRGLDARLLLDEVKALARRARIDLGDRYPADPYGLTDREREVLNQLAKGSTNRQIADVLYISEKTASVHVSNILRKLVVANRGEAAAKAIRKGLVGAPEL